MDLSWLLRNWLCVTLRNLNALIFKDALECQPFTKGVADGEGFETSLEIRFCAHLCVHVRVATFRIFRKAHKSAPKRTNSVTTCHKKGIVTLIGENSFSEGMPLPRSISLNIGKLST